MPFLNWKHAKAVLGIAALGVFIVVLPARADISGTVSGILSAIAQVIISLVSQVLVALIQILLAVTQYNDFINAHAVVKGWVLVRDVSNLAFLVIFIGIAFATILGVEKYEYKRLLPKLLIMAVFINFSRTICGLILDAAQVLMMTFVNGFKDVAAGNLIRGFGLEDMLSLRNQPGGPPPDVTPNTVAAASLLAVVMLIIATITVGVIVVMFLVRIIYLWILVLLSPLAFMLSAAPGLSGKFDEWWGKFIKYAFVGPIMAFFLWLSFSIMASVQPGSTLAQENNLSTGDYAERTHATITRIGDSDQLLSYGIAIALLLLSLSIASEMGVKGGKLAESALGKIRSGGAALAKVAGVAALTGGVGTIGVYGAYRGGRAFAKTTPGKWTGRRLDEVITTPTTRALGRLGARIFGEETRIGKGARKLAERGVLLRTVKQSWKERAESREKNVTAPYIGAGRDVLNQVIDDKDTNYVARHVLALANEEAKKQREEGDDSSEFFNVPILRVIQSGKPQNTKEVKGYWLNNYGKNDQNEITLSKDGYEFDKDGNVVRTISEEIHRRVLENFEKVLSAEEKAEVESYVALQEQLEKAVETGASDEELFNIGEQLRTLEGKFQPLQYEYSEHRKYSATDSPFARLEALKMSIGESDEAKQFAARLNAVALDNRNYAAFGLASRDTVTGKYDYTDLYSEKGFTAYNDAVGGKLRNINPPDLWRTHPSGLRNEVINKQGMRTYADNINSVGERLIILAAPGISERNLNMRPDTSSAFIGGVAPREYPDIYSVNFEQRRLAQRDFVEDNVLGYYYSFRPRISDEAHNRTVSPYLQRQGASKEDVELSPRQLLARHREKLAVRTDELQKAVTAYEQAVAAKVSEAELAKAKLERDNKQKDVDRIKTQIVRFVEHIRREDIARGAVSASQEGAQAAEAASPTAEEIATTEEAGGQIPP